MKEKKQKESHLPQNASRRTFVKGAAVGAVAAVATHATEGNALSFEQFFQKHYQEMSEKDKASVFKRIIRETKEDFGVDITLADPRPIAGVKFAFFLNLNTCNGSRFCVHACQKENNQDDSIQYIKVLELERGSFNLEHSYLYYDKEKVPREGKFYLPVQCNQCDNPPCVSACPTKATWKEKDGIVVIDYDWCIGCRYCQAACPYEARHFNFKKPSITKERFNANQSYLSNRVRERGVVEKCTFCLHRTREGRYPACLEACPTGARKFGNILDPQSDVSLILKHKRCFVLKEELHTIPSFYYYFD